ncbi:hypothetical protein EDD15DRAFT_2193523 [Pisolithus albus]|nr:hypothetical protein EDD15DRAFT_2193523 [Pisolithus albus]
MNALCPDRKFEGRPTFGTVKSEEDRKRFDYTDSINCCLEDTKHTLDTPKVRRGRVCPAVTVSQKRAKHKRNMKLGDQVPGSEALERLTGASVGGRARGHWARFPYRAIVHRSNVLSGLSYHPADSLVVIMDVGIIASEGNLAGQSARGVFCDVIRLRPDNAVGLRVHWMQKKSVEGFDPFLASTSTASIWSFCAALSFDKKGPAAAAVLQRWRILDIGSYDEPTVGLIAAGKAVYTAGRLSRALSRRTMSTQYTLPKFFSLSLCGLHAAVSFFWVGPGIGKFLHRSEKRVG